MTQWSGATVQKWLESRVVAARADQVEAQRAARSQHDDCDKATAEEMVCTILLEKPTMQEPKAFTADLRALLDRDAYFCRGVYNDVRFDRHVRTFIRKLLKMTKTNTGFDRTGRYQ